MFVGFAVTGVDDAHSINVLRLTWTLEGSHKVVMVLIRMTEENVLYFGVSGTQPHIKITC